MEPTTGYMRPAVAALDEMSDAPAEAPPQAPSPMSRDQLLAKRPPRTKDATIPGWGTLRLGEIRQRQKEQIDHLATKRVGGEAVTDYRLYMPRIIAASALNADNTPMFPDWEKAADQLADLPPAIVSALFEAAAEVNVLTQEAREALGKASSASPDDGS